MLLLIIMIYIDRFHFRNYDVTIRFFLSFFIYVFPIRDQIVSPSPTLQSHFNIFPIETRQNGHSKLPLQCEKLWGI